jgi:putative oxidoreductase
LNPTLTGRLSGLRARAESAASRLQSPLLLAVRLYWGWGFFRTGLGKLSNLGSTTEFFASLGIPAPGANAVLAAATECAGGALLFLGLGSRLAAAPLAATMLVAYATAHSDALRNVLSDPEGFTSQAPFLFLAAALLVLAFGPGAYSADALLARRSARHSAPRAAAAA